MCSVLDVKWVALTLTDCTLCPILKCNLRGRQLTKEGHQWPRFSSSHSGHYQWERLSAVIMRINHSANSITADRVCGASKSRWRERWKKSGKERGKSGGRVSAFTLRKLNSCHHERLAFERLQKGKMKIEKKSNGRIAFLVRVLQR